MQNKLRKIHVLFPRENAPPRQRITPIAGGKNQILVKKEEMTEKKADFWKESDGGIIQKVIRAIPRRLLF